MLYVIVGYTLLLIAIVFAEEVGKVQQKVEYEAKIDNITKSYERYKTGYTELLKEKLAKKNAESFKNAVEYSEAERYYKDGKCSFKCYLTNFNDCCMTCNIGNYCERSCGYACKEE